MKRNYYLVGLIVVTFFVISFLTNIIGALIPEIRSDFTLSLTLAGLLPFAFFIAYAVFSIPAGALVERYREKAVMMAAFFLASGGALLLALFPNFLTAVVSLFLIGAGMAMLQVTINPLLRVAGGEENFAFNSNLGQFFFGLASFVSPLYYSYLVTNLEGAPRDLNAFLDVMAGLVPEGLAWISVYWSFAVIAVLMVGVIAFFTFPPVERKEDELVGAFSTHLSLLKRPIVVLYFLGIFCYVGSEQGVANWMSEFLNVYHGVDPQTTGAQAVSWFWGMMTVGTFLGLGLLRLFKSRHILVAFSAGAILCLTTALLSPGAVAPYAFSGIGFFISIMYPVIISLALNSVEEHHGAFTGILMTGIGGGAIVPLIVGSLGDVVGLRQGLFFLYVTFGYILSIGLWADPIVENKTLDLGGDEEAVAS
jgi:fucose permease